MGSSIILSFSIFGLSPSCWSEESGYPFITTVNRFLQHTGERERVAGSFFILVKGVSDSDILCFFPPAALAKIPEVRIRIGDDDVYEAGERGNKRKEERKEIGTYRASKKVPCVSGNPIWQCRAKVRLCLLWFVAFL